MTTSTLDTAAELIERIYTERGACTLSCDCGAVETVVDSDAVGDDVAARRLAATIEHARYDHSSPRTVVATLHVLALDTAVEVTR